MFKKGMIFCLILAFVQVDLICFAFCLPLYKCLYIEVNLKTKNINNKYMKAIDQFILQLIFYYQYVIFLHHENMPI